MTRYPSLLTTLVVALVSYPPQLAANEGFSNHLVLLYKGTYVAYGNGRASERDLPECRGVGVGDGVEACNLSHRRYWRPPLVERLCRCPGHAACPLHHYGNSTEQQAESNGGVRTEQQAAAGTPLVQHISNRAHLQFCNVGVESSLKPCGAGETGLTVELVERLLPASLHLQYQGQDGAPQLHNNAGMSLAMQDSHTTLHCLCPVPRYWRLIATTTTTTTTTTRSNGRRATAPSPTEQLLKTGLVFNTTTHTYECQQLPTCSSDERCSDVRPDTHASYYTCSCPPAHLCLIPKREMARVNAPPHTLPHYDGRTKRGVCTPQGARRRWRWFK